MNFTVNRKQFLSALKISAQAIQAKNLLPIMESVKLDLTANNSILTITGGNEDMYIINTCQIAEPSDGEYSVCINAEDAISAISSIDDDSIILDFDMANGTEIVEIQYKRGKLSYPYFSAKEYSVMPVANSDSKVSIPEDVLSHLINKTIKFVGDDALRPTMNGINFNVGGEGDGIVVCAATDGSKLCKVSVSDIDTEGCKERQSFMLPNKACRVVAKSMPSNPSDEMVNISFSEKNIIFKIGNVSIFARCIEGKAPNYNAVIPKNNDTIIELSKLDLISVIERVSKSLSKGYRVINLNLLLSGIVPEVAIVADDLYTKTSGRESMDCIIGDDSVRGDMSIGLNKDHIGIAVSNASTPNIKMSFSSPVRPILIEGYDGDEGVTMLVMPFVSTN